MKICNYLIKKQNKKHRIYLISSTKEQIQISIDLVIGQQYTSTKNLSDIHI